MLVYYQLLQGLAGSQLVVTLPPLLDALASKWRIPWGNMVSHQTQSGFLPNAFFRLQRTDKPMFTF